MTLVIANLAGTSSVTMPVTKNYNYVDTPVYNRGESAAKKRFYEIIGYRPEITVAWEYIPDASLKTLLALVRANVLCNVTYTDANGTSLTKAFEITMSPVTVFKYVSGVPMWCNLTLTMSAQEVI